MKKLFITIFAGLSLISCNTSNNYNSSNSCSLPISVSNSSTSNITFNSFETITLSKDNFSTYIATNTSIAFVPKMDYSDYHIFYYTYFIGADNCRFIDCTITYCYSSGSTYTKRETVSLTISGDGEAKPYMESFSKYSNNFSFSLVSASGTIKVY